MVEHLAFHAAKLIEIRATVADEELLTTGRMREARMSQALAVRAEDVLFWTREALDALCNNMYILVFFLDIFNMIELN